MNYIKFEYPYTGSVTATVVISSCAVSLPKPRKPELNQIITESKSGVRQTASLGDPRETMTIRLPNLDHNDYEDLKNFLESSITDTWTSNYSSTLQTGGIEYRLRPFKLTDMVKADRYSPPLTPNNWVFFVESYDHHDLKGMRHDVTIQVKERIAP